MGAATPPDFFNIMIISIHKPKTEEAERIHRRAKLLARLKGESLAGMIWRLLEKEVQDEEARISVAEQSGVISQEPRRLLNEVSNFKQAG